VSRSYNNEVEGLEPREIFFGGAEQPPTQFSAEMLVDSINTKK